MIDVHFHLLPVDIYYLVNEAKHKLSDDEE